MMFVKGVNVVFCTLFLPSCIFCTSWGHFFPRSLWTEPMDFSPEDFPPPLPLHLQSQLNKRQTQLLSNRNENLYLVSSYASPPSPHAPIISSSSSSPVSSPKTSSGSTGSSSPSALSTSGSSSSVSPSSPLMSVSSQSVVPQVLPSDFGREHMPSSSSSLSNLFYHNANLSSSPSSAIVSISNNHKKRHPQNYHHHQTFIQTSQHHPVAHPQVSSQSSSPAVASSTSASSSSLTGSHSLDKSLLDLLTVTNFSLPLSSEKYFWMTAAASDPDENRFLHHHHVRDHPKSSSPLLPEESAKNDVNIEPIALKVASLCDRTLALVEYEHKTSSNESVIQLKQCELFDLEKSPEIGYNEAKKVGAPVEPVTFQHMRDTINACRILAESEQLTSGTSSATSSGQSDYPKGNSTLSSSGSQSTQVTASTSGASSAASSATSSSSTDKSSYWSSWRALLPGTKWCGMGDSAKNYFDLGKRRDVDVCCRAHDHCPIRLKALRMGYGLINLSLYTKSHCECDEDFMRCLKQANSKLAENLGNFYFNIMKVQCIKEEKVYVCLEYGKDPATGKEVCTKYEQDKSATKMVFTQPETTYK